QYPARAQHVVMRDESRNIIVKIKIMFSAINLIKGVSSEFGHILSSISLIKEVSPEFGHILFSISLIKEVSPEFGHILSSISLIKEVSPEFGHILSSISLIKEVSRLCPYNCVKEKSHSHPHDTIILDQQNFVGGNENDSTQFYLKLRRTKRTNY